MALCSKFNLFTKDKRHGGALGVFLSSATTPTVDSFIVKANCESSEITLYREYLDAPLQIGNTLYEDEELTITYSGGQFVADDGNRYYLESGVITSSEVFSCLLPITIYTDCFNSNPTTRYVQSISSPLNDGTFLYFAPDGGSVATDPTFFSYEGYMYNYEGGMGTVNTGLCFP